MRVKIHKIQPGQLYINEEKFKKIWEKFNPENYEPIPIKELE